MYVCVRSNVISGKNFFLKSQRTISYLGCNFAPWFALSREFRFIKLVSLWNKPSFFFFISPKCSNSISPLRPGVNTSLDFSRVKNLYFRNSRGRKGLCTHYRAHSRCTFLNAISVHARIIDFDPNANGLFSEIKFRHGRSIVYTYVSRRV